jgi:hypothetical protein
VIVVFFLPRETCPRSGAAPLHEATETSQNLGFESSLEDERRKPPRSAARTTVHESVLCALLQYGDTGVLPWPLPLTWAWERQRYATARLRTE